eukprot:4583685-Prymnesium_polylepis.1
MPAWRASMILMPCASSCWRIESELAKSRRDLASERAWSSCTSSASLRPAGAGAAGATGATGAMGAAAAAE